MSQILIIIAVLLFVVLKATIFIFKEYERGVIFTLGRLKGAIGPGLKFVIPFVQRVVRIDQRVVTMDVPGQDVITKDNVSVKVNAVLYFRVMDPSRAVVEVENYHYATSQLSQTTLRSVCGEAELDDLLTKREELNQKIAGIIDRQTDPWGIKVTLVELKHIDLPQEMQRAMARQAEAERERRAKIIKAEGEYQAAQKLTDAAQIMAQQDITLQLRYMETLRDISSNNSATVVLPLPIDIIKFLGGNKNS